MATTISAVFPAYYQALEAAKHIRTTGLRTSDISVVTYEDDRMPPDPAMSGSVSRGGLIGGAAGLLLGMGTVAVPGLGVLAAAGPIAGLMGGAAAGGVAGAMSRLGIPAHIGAAYERELQNGNTVWSMRCDDRAMLERVQAILLDCGAIRTEIS